VLDSATIEAWRRELPELPRDKRQRFVAAYGLPEYDAGVLAAARDIADFFEATTHAGAPAKAASNWIMTEVMRVLAERETDIGALPLTAAALAGLLQLVEAKAINTPTAKDVFAVLVEKGGDAADIVKEKGLAQVSDTGAIEAFVQQAMEANPKSVEDFRNGKVAAAKFLVGQVMRLSCGKANPQLVNEILERLLG